MKKVTQIIIVISRLYFAFGNPRNILDQTRKVCNKKKLPERFRTVAVMSSFSDSSKATCDNSSESFHDAFCSPCSKDGNLVHGVFYCLECKVNLCNTCIKLHNKFEKLQNHVIVKNDDVHRISKKQESRDGELLPLPTEICTIHHDRVLDMYCTRHDTVGCITCIATEHR